MTQAVAKLTTEIEQLSSILLSTLDETVFFGELSKFIHAHANSDNVILYKINEDQSAALVAKNGIGIENGEVLAKGIGPQGQIVRTKRAYYSNNVSRDPLFAREAGQGVQRELCIPVICDGIVIGTVHVQSLNEEGEFKREDISFIQSILDKISGPLRNMKMYLAAKYLNESLLKEIEEKEEQLAQRRNGLKVADTYKVEDVKIVGKSERMKSLVGLAHKVAGSNISALVQGMSGTGKEMIARRIHCRSEKAQGPFISVDCTTLSTEALEIALFGAEANETTNASEGLLEVADQGTLFIDNVDALPLQIQSKLARFMNEGMAFRVRGQVPFRSNVRIISATTKQLAGEVENGLFREDLFYALATVVLNTPSLTERVEDIEVLATYFLNLDRSSVDHKSFSPGAISALNDYQWPGNVRELQSIIERAYILSDGSIVERDHLPESVVNAKACEEQEEEAPDMSFSEMTLDELERFHICRTLEHLSGNKTKTAKTLGITVKTLYNKLHSYGMIAAKEA